MSKRKEPSSIASSPIKTKKQKREILDSDFSTVQASLVLSVPPVFAPDPRAGVQELLDSMIMRSSSFISFVGFLSSVLQIHTSPSRCCSRPLQSFLRVQNGRHQERLPIPSLQHKVRCHGVETTDRNAIRFVLCLF
jgi:hypothetical protein